jgi:hypothetical protein
MFGYVLYFGVGLLWLAWLAQRPRRAIAGAAASLQGA